MNEPPGHDHAIKIALLEQSIHSIKEQLAQLNANLSKLVWAVIIALVLAFVQFALRGGLHVG